MDLEINVSTEFTTKNSLLLQEGPVSKERGHNNRADLSYRDK